MDPSVTTNSHATLRIGGMMLGKSVAQCSRMQLWVEATLKKHGEAGVWVVSRDTNVVVIHTVDENGLTYAEEVK